MANHVISHISFENLSEEATQFLSNIMPSFDTPTAKVLEYFFEESEDTMNTYAWCVDNLGAKWVNFEEIGEDTFNMFSAWSFPKRFADTLYEKLVSLNSPNLEMWCTYEDEMPNFIGVYGRGPYEAEYEEELDENLYEEEIGSLPYNEETEEFNDEWWELAYGWQNREKQYFQEILQEQKELWKTIEISYTY